MKDLKNKKIGNWKLKIGNSWQHQSGFTLIELIVVMAIIGILASVVMVNFIGVRARSRDGVRKSDLSQIRNALEIYRSDVGTYPLSLKNCGSPLTYTDLNGNVVTYMQKIPCDPLNNNSYFYSADSEGLTYSITSCLENKADTQQDKDSDGSPKPYDQCKNSPFGASYTVTNP